MGVIRSPQPQQHRQMAKQRVYKCRDWMAIEQFTEGRKSLYDETQTDSTVPGGDGGGGGGGSDGVRASDCC